MSGFIDNTNDIDTAEIAAEYRTPHQGATAKSNSNVAYGDYFRMTPRANQASNGVTTASSQTLQAQDFGGTAGFTQGSDSYNTGFSKGSSTTILTGVASSSGMNVASGGNLTTTIGFFGLGSQGGTSGISLTNVASFASGTTLHGVVSAGAGLGGQFYIVTAGASGATNWTKVHIRQLYPNGFFTSGSSTIYNNTTTLNRSIFTYNGNATGGTESWQVSYGFGGTISTSPVGILYPFTVEFE